MTLAALWTGLLLAAHLAGWGGWVDLPALALVAVGWGSSLDRAVPAAWLLGLGLDAASLGPLGPQAMAWSAAAAALGVEQRAAHRTEWPTLMLAAALVSLWLSLATGCLAPRGPATLLGGAGLAEAGLAALGTALAAPVLVWPVRSGWVLRRGGA